MSAEQNTHHYTSGQRVFICEGREKGHWATIFSAKPEELMLEIRANGPLLSIAPHKVKTSDPGGIKPSKASLRRKFQP